MTLCPEEKRDVIVEHLRTSVRNGKMYFKSKNIADELDMSSREVGCNLNALAEEGAAGLDIEPWSVTRATTWKVELKPQSVRQGVAIASD